MGAVAGSRPAPLPSQRVCHLRGGGSRVSWGLGGKSSLGQEPSSWLHVPF